MICFVTDPGAPAAIPDQAEAAARGGVDMVQLREKDIDDDGFVALALEIRRRIASHGTTFILNDRVHLLEATGADGVHVGQTDGDPVGIRAGATLGVSVEDARHLKGLREGVAYLGVGPIRATTSKPDHAPPIGVDGFARIARATPLPCLAIGGVTGADAAALKAAGAAGLAVVSAISRATDMSAAAEALVAAWRSA